MPLSFDDRVGLIDRHGHAGVEALRRLEPDDANRRGAAREIALELRDTMEIWACALERPAHTVAEHVSPPDPDDFGALIADVSLQLARVSTALRASGPDATIDYFGRPGSAAELAHLLAHQAVEFTHQISVAVNGPRPTVSPTEADDIIDQALAHWATSSTDVVWRPEAILLRSTDSRSEWFIDVPVRSDETEQFRLAQQTSTPASVVRGAASDLLWWLHGHPIPVEVNGTAQPEARVSLTGAAADLVALHHALSLPVPKALRRRRWRWFG